MLKLKEIEKKLNKKQVRFYRTEDGQGIVIEPPCQVLTENSLFGYFDKTVSPQVLKEEFWYLKDDHRVLILTCEECCGCGDW